MSPHLAGGCPLPGAKVSPGGGISTGFFVLSLLRVAQCLIAAWSFQETAGRRRPGVGSGWSPGGEWPRCACGLRGRRERRTLQWTEGATDEAPAVHRGALRRFLPVDVEGQLVNAIVAEVKDNPGFAGRARLRPVPPGRAIAAAPRATSATAGGGGAAARRFEYPGGDCLRARLRRPAAPHSRLRAGHRDDPGGPLGARLVFAPLRCPPRPFPAPGVREPPATLRSTPL